MTIIKFIEFDFAVSMTLMLIKRGVKEALNELKYFKLIYEIYQKRKNELHYKNV